MSRRILIVSDTHGRDASLCELMDKMRPFDVLIHLGDGEGSEDMLMDYAGPLVQCHFVQGNNDFFSRLDKDKEIMLGGKRWLLTHGHNYGVSLDIQMLAREARARGCHFALFGHTHRPCFKELEGVVCINPGSLSFPRQADRRRSYILAELDERGEFHFTQNYLE